ncbi:immunity 17 family protein [Carboxylicivirga sp. RSCT41]|uniref:immunity 17 family protein n=1 Tax=Carboxylicivirga agarovorans TaxID=3417570 RepID=UPI003D3520DC
MNKDVLFYLMTGVGAIIFVASLTNWEWFFKQRRAQILVKAMGRNGARIFYALLGIFFAVFGWMVLSGRIAIDSLF